MNNWQLILQNQLYLNPLISKLGKKSFIIQFALFTSFYIVFSYSFIYLSNLLFNIPRVNILGESYSLGEQIFLIVFFAPLIETLIFQYLVIETFDNYRPKQIFLACFTSSAFFALTHVYHVMYFIYALIGGFILAIAFYSGGKGWRGFLLVFLIHAFYNGFAFIVNHYF